VIDSMAPENMTFTASAPSNIAFVKYWGKRDAAMQWPANDSLSMTLTRCRTITSAKKIPGSRDIFRFEGRELTSDNPSSSHKVFEHLGRLRDELRVSSAIEITSQNTFPTACGIASSASGFAALTLAATAALTGETEWDKLAVLGMPRQRLAHLARMGSGSAGRSIFGGFVHWAAGDTANSQEIVEICPSSHWGLSDLVIVFSGHSKHTSSSDAHKAAWGSPFFPARLAGIDSRMERVTAAIKTRNIEALGEQIESDALEMHAVAMTGTPAANYIKEDTAKFLAWVRQERSTGGLPAWFTIDAGPNVHLICETTACASIAKRVSEVWPQVRVIMDQIGPGPVLVRGTAKDLLGEVTNV
jgi:diphosphomevalonate decarboxylase